MGGSEGRPATRAVFDALLVDIVKGTYPPGTRLPSERDLATSLSASRPTVREALRRLSEWGLVVARRGSGIAVQPMSGWSLDVLPAYLRHAPAAAGGPPLGQMIRDILELRKHVLSDLSRMVGGRLNPEEIGRAREKLEEAWVARDTPAFVTLDFEVYRCLAESAGMYPGLWLLNTVGRVYADIASRIVGAMGPPDFYLESYGRYFGALQRGDGDEAAAIVAEYYDRHDAILLAMLAPRGTTSPESR